MYSMRRTKAEAAVTRAVVLKKALSVFSAKGYAAATLDDVAKAAKVTRGAIYWHFKSKADLYNTLIQESSARGAVVVQQAIAEGGTLNRPNCCNLRSPGFRRDRYGRERQARGGCPGADHLRGSW
jgi:AcrR family transcriptional regulator